MALAAFLADIEEVLMKLHDSAILTILTLTFTASSALAQANNTCTTVVLHAVPGLNATCTPTLDCTNVPPTTRIDGPSGPYTFFMFLKNYEDVGCVQVAFDWPLNWSFGFGLWQCQVAQVVGTAPTAPGPINGTIATCFNAVTGGKLAPIGLMVFSSLGPSGCLSIIETGYPLGNIVLDSMAGKTPLADVNEGRVCVGADGHNTCDCQIATAVEAATWGQIKATY
jgi:hypothetical protein